MPHRSTTPPPTAPVPSAPSAPTSSGAAAAPGAGDAAQSAPTPGADLEDVARAAAAAFDLLPADRPAPSGRTGLPQRLETDPDSVERDLAKLVLTIIELLRQLMERAALHRVDHQDLTEEQEERIGLTLMTLEERMAELCDRHGLELDDLNLDLGPLGSLLPRG